METLVQRRRDWLQDDLVDAITKVASELYVNRSPGREQYHACDRPCENGERLLVPGRRGGDWR